MKTIRIFISSPSDVTEERDKARLVITDLQRGYEDQLRLVPVLWEDLALPATASFQEGIEYILNEKHHIDIAVFILWSRLGSPLGPAIRKPDDTPYLSGTEREFELMLAAFERSGRKIPIILAYTRQDEKGFSDRLDSTRETVDSLEELLRQRKLVNNFILENFQDQEGHNLRAYHSYSEPVGFAQSLHIHLRSAIHDLLDIDLSATIWTEAPYRSLEVFDIWHSPIFCGREQETCDLLQRLRDQQRNGCAFVCIIGASGSGKSSLARAGVAATLIQRSFEDGLREWLTAILLPGLAQGDLSTALARALAEALPRLRTGIGGLPAFTACLREQNITAAGILLQAALDPRGTAAAKEEKPAENVLLILDQMEELWTDHSISAPQRDHFLQTLEALARTGPISVLATLRSDFYPAAQLSEAFLRMKAERGHFDLPPPAPAALQQIIVQPARRSGLRFERDGRTEASLDELILKDAARDPSALPLLQYALAELFERRDESRRTLTFSAYSEMGGVEGALGKRATQTFERLPPQAKATIEEVLPLLISVDANGGQNAVRTRAMLDDLNATPLRQQLTSALIAARFITTGEQDGAAVATLAHEALIRSWDLIVRWVAANRQQLGVRSRIEHQRQRWQKLGQRSDLLLPEGLDLQEGLSLLREAPHLLHGAEYRPVAEFIRASHATDEARQKRTTRRRRGAFAIMSALTLVAVIGGIYANGQREEAQKQTRIAEANAYEATNQRHIAEVNQVQAQEQSKIAQANALKAQEQSGIATANAVKAEQQAEIARKQSSLAEQRASLALGRQLCLESQLLRTSSASLLDRSLLLAVEGARRADGPDADRALRGSLDLLPKMLFEKSTGQSHANIAMTPDGTLVAAATAEQEITLWKTADGQPTTTLKLEAPVAACAFSPDGRQLAIAEMARIVLQQISPSQQRRLALPAASFREFAFSPESRLLATATEAEITLWDTTSGTVLKQFAVPAKTDCLLFSPDGQSLAAGAYDAKVRVWNVKTGQLQLTGEHEPASATMPLRPGSRDGGVFGLAFHPSGKFMASAAQGGSVSVWKLEGGAHIFDVRHSDSAYSVAFSPDGRWMASGGMDHKVRITDLRNFSETHTLKHTNWVETVRFTPDGRLISVSGDGTARMWDMVTGQELIRMFDTKAIDCFDISADATRAVTGAWSGNVRVWDLTTAGGAQKLYHEDARGFVVSADGSLVVTNGDNTVLQVFSLPDGRLLSKLELKTFTSSILVTHDSRHIITASRDGQVRVWDSATGKVVRQFGHETERTVNAAFVPGHENLLVTAGMEDGTARLWDFDKGQEIRRFLHGGVVDTLKTMFPKGGVRSTAFLPDQKTLITGGNDGTVRFWNLDDGKELYRLEIGQYIQDLLLAPKGDFIVVSAEDETSVWTLPARQKVSSLSMSAEGDQFASALCLNADGSLLFEGGNRSRPSVRVRSLPDLKKVAELLHEHSIFSAALTQDQTRLVTGSQDNRVRVWDTQTWQMTAQFETQDIVYEVALINKDQSIIAASSDGFIRIWPFSTALLLRNARGKLHRDLTQEEWHQYFGDLPYNFTRASKN